MSLFNDDIMFQSQEEKTSAKIIKANSKKKMILADRTKNIAELLPIIENGFDYHILANGSFGSIDLLNHLNNIYDIDKAYLNTWSFNTTFVNLITEMSDKTEINFIVDKSISQRKHALHNQIKELSINGQIKFKESQGLHCKVTLLKVKDIYISQ